MFNQAKQILNTVFGYPAFRGLQEDIIKHVLDGHDALVLMPTGGGKSLCFQIPAIVRSGMGVVISPLIALMQDQVSGLKELGVKAAFLNSSQNFDQMLEVEKQVRNGELDLLYLAPERLLKPGFIDSLKKSNLALFAIDEAHCVSQWGHDFRPEYLGLSVIQENFPNIPKIALTATADEITRVEIVNKLALNNAKIFVAGFDRPNINYQVVLKDSPRDQLLSFIQEKFLDESGIVYCLSRKKVEDTATWLKSKGINAYPYHAGMSQEERKKNQDIFINEEKVVIVATIAFGMGIDKPNVRFVAHLDLPKSIESYYQETGRAGRDGLPACAWMAYGLGDVVTLRQMLESSDADEAHKLIERRKLDTMLGFCETVKCRRQVLLNYFGDTSEHACGNCDTCLEPPKTWDGGLAAQKALSCVFRTEQRFGTAYLVDILIGADNPRIKQFRHDKLAVYGLGKDLSKASWLSIYRQLVAAGYLSVDMQSYGSLKLTSSSKALLKGELKIDFRIDPPAKPRTSKKNRNKVEQTENGEKSSDTFQSSIQNPNLWEALRACRLALSKKQKVPPYLIFHDSSLKEMASLKPKSLDELATISGVGAVKLSRYGDEFLQVIKQYA